MAEAGYSADKPLELSLTYANIYGTELGDQLRSQLKPIGIDLKVNVVEFSTWLQDVYTNHDFDISLVDHNESHDFASWTDPTYYFGYDNKDVTKLYNEGRQVGVRGRRCGLAVQLPHHHRHGQGRRGLPLQPQPDRPAPLQRNLLRRWIQPEVVTFFRAPAGGSCPRSGLRMASVILLL